MPWNLLPFLICVYAAPIAPKGLGPQTWLGIWHIGQRRIYAYDVFFPLNLFPIVHASQRHFWGIIYIYVIIMNYYDSYWILLLDAESTLHNCCLQLVSSPIVIYFTVPSSYIMLCTTARLHTRVNIDGASLICKLSKDPCETNTWSSFTIYVPGGRIHKDGCFGRGILPNSSWNLVLHFVYVK